MRNSSTAAKSIKKNIYVTTGHRWGAFIKGNLQYKSNVYADKTIWRQKPFSFQLRNIEWL